MIPTALIIGFIGGFTRWRAIVVLATGVLWAILLAASDTGGAAIAAGGIIAAANAAIASLVGATWAHFRGRDADGD